MSIFKNFLGNLYAGLVEKIPSFSSITESIVKNLIIKQLGQYIDIPSFQLKSFKNVELENVRLKIEEINEKFLSISPFIITYGQIGKMKINIPLQEILSMPSSVEIDSVQIYLRPNGNNISHEFFEQRFQNLLKEKKPQHKEDEEQYDADKMNELKTFLLHLLFNIRATVKNIVVKIFLQPEMSKGVEEPYFMVRISQLKTIDQNSSKLQQNSQLDCSALGSVSDTEQYQKSQMSTIEQQSTIQGNNQNNNEQIRTISLQVKRLDIFLLKNSSLSPEEFNNQSSAGGTYPFSYPKSNHPTNLLHIPEISLRTDYPVKTQNLNPKIICSLDMDSFEIMIEPYQLKFIKVLIDILESWKKQTSCLNLLLFTKDQQMRELIIQNNLEQTQQLEGRFSASQKPQEKRIKEKEIESDMDDMIYQSIAEFKEEFRKMPKKDNKIKQQPEVNFFNQSIMDGGPFGNKNKAPFDQSVFFDNQTMENLICNDMKKRVEQEKKRGSSGSGDQGNKNQSPASSLDLKIVVRKLGIYMLKDSVRGWKEAVDGKGSKVNGSIIEYERVWSNSKKKSISNPNKSKENASKDQVRCQIPCSYFVVKIRGAECQLNTEQSKLYVEADLNSFKILDVSLNKGSSKNIQFLKQAKINEISKQQTSVSATSRSTFWKENKLPHLLQPFQLQEGQHFCANPIIIYKLNTKNSSKDNSTNPFFKVHSIPVTLFKEQTFKKDQFQNKNINNDTKKQESKESAYKKDIKMLFPLEYENVKTRQGYQDANIKDQQWQKLLKMTIKKETSSNKKVNMSQEGQQNNSNCNQEDNKKSPRFGANQNSNENSKGCESQASSESKNSLLEEQISVVDIEIRAGGFTNICIDLRFLLDLVAISNPSEKYSEYQAEKMHKELLEKAPKYVAPSQALKLMKSLERKDVKADVEISKITWMVLSYKFQEFFISTKDVSGIYEKSPYYNCMCSNNDANKASNSGSSNKSQKSIGSYSNQSLAGVIYGLALLQEKKGEVKVSFEELNGFIVDISTHRIGKILHIGKNLVLSSIENSPKTTLSVVYPSIISCTIKPSGLKGDNNYFDVTQSHQEPLRLSQKIVHISSEEQEQQNQQGTNQMPNQTRFKTANLPEDTFYKENEQEATLDKVKKVIKIGFPVLELYLFERDLVSLGEVVFNIKSMIDIVDQYKFRIQDIQSFYDGTDSSAVVSNQMNTVLDLQLYEVNCYYGAAISQKQDEKLVNQPQQSQDPFRNSQGSLINESLVLHMKTVDVQIILNKEIKKEGKAKNFKLTLDVFLMVGEIMLADNSLKGLLCRNSNDAVQDRRMQSLQVFPNGNQQLQQQFGSQRMQTQEINIRKSSEQFSKQMVEDQQNELSHPGRKHSQQYNKIQSISDQTNPPSQSQSQQQQKQEQTLRFKSFQNDQQNQINYPLEYFISQCYPLFRIKSLFLHKQPSSKVLLYKMNLQSSLNSQIANLTQFSTKKSTTQNNPISSLKPNSRLILNVNNLRFQQYPTISDDKQLLFNIVIKKKEQLQTQFTSSKCKSQLNIKKMTLSHSVFGVSPMLLSKQLIGLITELQYFMALEKLSSDVFPKTEFKEIKFNPSDLGLLNDVMLDVFMSYDLQMLINSPMLIVSDKTIQHLQSLPLTDLNQRFMGSFREVIAIDSVNLQFKSRTQLTHKANNADKNGFELTKQKLFSEFKVDIEKITIDFLQQSNFDCGIDPFQLDFFFTEISSTILPYLGLSRLATLFNLSCWESLDSPVNINLHRLQIALYSDTFNVLPNLLSATGIFLKDSSEKLEQDKQLLNDAQKYQQDAETRLIIAIGKAAQQNGDNLFAQQFQIEILSESEGEEEEEKEESIFQDKHTQQSNIKQLESQRLLQNNIPLVNKMSNQPTQMLQGHNKTVKDLEKNKKEILQEKGWIDDTEFEEDNFGCEEYGDELGQNIPKGQMKQNQKNIFDATSRQKNVFEQDKSNKQSDDSFEKIDGEEIIVDEDLLKIKDSMSFQIENIGIYLYDRLDFDFVSVSTQYSISEQQYLQPILPESKPATSTQQLNQQTNLKSLDQIKNPPIKFLDIQVDNNHLQPDKEEQEEKLFQPIHVRERRTSKKKQSAGDYLLFKIESLKFSIDKYLPNENDITSKYSMSIQTISMDDAFLRYTILSTSPASAVDTQEFLKFSCFVQTNTNQKNENVILENLNLSNKSETVISSAPKIVIVTIKSISLAIHQNIYLNFSQQGTEFLLKFLGKATQKSVEAQQTVLTNALNRYLNKNNINFLPLKEKSKVQSISAQKSQITVIELLCIPQISIFFSNKKEDFKFSELLKKQGFLQIINLGEFEAIELVLVPLIIEDRNIEIIGQEIAKQWKENIIQNQKWSVVSKLPFIKNISNIGTGVYNLFYMPISYYQQGLSVVEGTYEGVKSFVKNTTTESISLTNTVLNTLGSFVYKNAKNCSNALKSKKSSSPELRKQKQP